MWKDYNAACPKRYQFPLGDKSSSQCVPNFSCELAQPIQGFLLIGNMKKTPFTCVSPNYQKVDQLENRVKLPFEEHSN